VTVTTSSGALEGLERNGILQFRGIPFAAPPIGPARFKAPQPVEPWTGTRPATEFGLCAPQHQSPLEAAMGAPPFPWSEDCLFLNVYTPACDDKARPVMVWIHGGAYVNGSGSIPWYDGSMLARQHDVVVVTINYRLGPFGYLHLEDVLGHEYAGSGNTGLLDQVAALRWVQREIDAFGGDPGRVTIFGESAGGFSVATLLGTPAAAGLFHRAIAQSGALRNVSRADVAADVCERMLDELGLSSGSADAIVELPADRVLDAADAVGLALLARRFEAGDGPERALPWQPVVDGAVLARHPLEMVAAGEGAQVPLVIGTTSEEFTMFAMAELATFDEALLHDRAARIFGERAPAVLEVYGRARPGASPYDLWVAIGTDWAFRIPMVRLAEAHGRHQPVHAYEFSYQSTAFGGMIRAGHSIDVPFPFDNVHKRGVDLLLGTVDDDTRRLASTMAGAWASFATDGTPAVMGLDEWPRYEPADRAVLELGRRVAVRLDPAADERAAWDGVM
jgi:para-nitrobenzyl esterase